MSSDMNSKITQLVSILLRKMRGRSKNVAHKLCAERLRKMSSTKSQIEELWELADFESLASLQFQPEDQGAKHILNEARAALRLLNSPTLSEIGAHV